MLFNYPYPVKYIELQGGVNMAYMDYGSGPQTYVFIHGLANYGPVWKFQMESLSLTSRCIAIDLPGNGYSKGKDYPYNIFFYAECVKNFCEQLALTNVKLTGHSMGGQIALMLGLRYGAMFDKLNLIAPAGLEAFSLSDKLLMESMLSFGEMMYSDEVHINSAIKDGFFKQHQEQQTIINDMITLLNHTNKTEWRKMTKSCILSMLNDEVYPHLQLLNLPVTIIFGEADALIPNKLLHPHLSIEKLLLHAETCIPNCETHVIKQAGHFVQIEKHKDVNKLLV